MAREEVPRNLSVPDGNSQVTDDIKNMGSLLNRMTETGSKNITLSENQINAVVEVLIPRIATNMPGMPEGMTCSVEKDETGWTIRVEKPAG